MTKSLVFVHGLGLGQWVFREHFAPYYESHGYEVHTFDLPAHRREASTAQRQELTFESCVDFVGRYLKEELTSPYIIVGMSMGGGICQRLLESGTEFGDMRGVVLLSSVPPMNNLRFTLTNCRRLALDKPQALVDFFRGSVNPSLVFSESTLTEMPVDKCRQYLHRIYTGFFRLEYQLFFSDIVSGRVESNIPVKVIGGRDDWLLSREVFEFTASCYGTTAEILPDLGHMIPVEPHCSRATKSIDTFIGEVFQ